MIQSSGYKSEHSVVWQLEAEQLDFGKSEFEELLAYIKQGRLFSYLEQHRPALKASLLEIFTSSLDNGIWEEDDLEHHLENALRNLALKLEHQD